MLDFSETELKQSFSANLKQLLAQAGVGEIVLSEGAGISQSAVNRIKNGTVCPSLYQAFRIARFFNVSLISLINTQTEATAERDYYVPVLNARDFIDHGQKNIIGFFAHDAEDMVGFKYDSSFACKALSKDSVIIIQKLPKKQNITEGNMLLYVDDEHHYHIGNVTKGVIKPLDDISTLFAIEQVVVIGKVAMIENRYIKDSKLVKQISQKIGEDKLTKVVDTVLGLG